MQLILDTVQGHDLQTGIYVGQIVRRGLIILASSEINPLSTTTPSPTVLTRAMALSEMPQKGDSYPAAGYEQYYLKNHRIYSVSAQHLILELEYIYNGAFFVRDSSNLSMVATQIHPKDKKPIVVSWKPSAAAITANPELTNQLTPKVATINAGVPMRNLTMQRTVDFLASGDVLGALGSVNSQSWEGLGPGYWLVTAVDGMTEDDGLTYTYSVTVTTKQIEDWSMGAFWEHEGKPIMVDPVVVADLMSRPYFYGVEYPNDFDDKGIVKVGLYPTTDFGQIFGNLSGALRQSRQAKLRARKLQQQMIDEQKRMAPTKEMVRAGQQVSGVRDRDLVLPPSPKFVTPLKRRGR